MLNSSKILEKIENDFRGNFEKIRKIHYNPTAKGHDYEETLKEFFEKYLGNLFNFYARVPIYDSGLECQSIFGNRENEFDVVASHKNAFPKIVFEAGATQFIPYDSTAFIT